MTITQCIAELKVSDPDKQVVMCVWDMDVAKTMLEYHNKLNNDTKASALDRFIELIDSKTV